MEPKRNFRETMGRLDRFWRGQMSHGILARIDVRNPALERFVAENDYPTPTDSPPPVEYSFRYWDARLAMCRQVEDDALPVAYLSQYEGIGAFNKTIEQCYIYDRPFGWFSSSVKPFLTSWEEMESLAYQENAPMLKSYLDDLRYFREHGAGEFYVGAMMTNCGLNLAASAMGDSETLYAIYDGPEILKKAAVLAHEAYRKIHQKEREILGFWEGGIFDFIPAFGTWLPWDVIQISIDTYHHCRPGLLSELEFELIQELMNGIGHGFFHIHSNGWHLIPEVMQLKKLAGIWLCNESPRPFDHLSELREATGPVPLVVECHAAEFVEGLRKGALPGNIFYWVKGESVGAQEYAPAVERIEEAHAIMEEVRAYRDGGG